MKKYRTVYALFCQTPYRLGDQDPMLVRVYFSKKLAKDVAEESNKNCSVGRVYWVETVELNTQELEESFNGNL